MTVPEHPGKDFFATVEASAQAVDVSSGTTRMLLVVDNADRQLMTGGFANVSFDLPHPEVAVNVPASAMIFDKSGLRVAIVDSTNHVVLKTVTISRDLGRVVEIGTGLTAQDRVIDSPPDGIESGDQVRLGGSPDLAADPHTAAAQ
jgi:multidrug efflux pump subunit AcrA (membrane-fusion protein)